jgi:AraC family transcriptional regulator
MRAEFPPSTVDRLVVDAVEPVEASFRLVLEFVREVRAGGRWQSVALVAGRLSAAGSIGVMPLLERVRTDQVIVGPFYHEPGEPVVSVEWWQEPCIAFTAFGSWEIRGSRGKGQVTPGSVLASEGGAEYECQHPDGVGDRMVCVLYRGDVDPGPVLVVPQVSALRSLRRSLAAQLRLSDPDPDEVEELSRALLGAVREAPPNSYEPGARSRALVARLRAEADARYREPGLDLVAHARALGVGRTRFVHMFREVVGVTPHRYVVELRAGHAARLLTGTRLPVTDICFESGFGSMPSFYAAFRAAYGATPGTYRAGHDLAGGAAHFS